MPCQLFFLNKKIALDFLKHTKDHISTDKICSISNIMFFITTPIGTLIIHSRGETLALLEFADDELSLSHCKKNSLKKNELKISEWMHDYFGGYNPPMLKDDIFSWELVSHFSRKVLTSVCAIPYGTTVSYGALASQHATAPRAIGRALAKNPYPILIPCHRVIGAQGDLKGYGGQKGIDRKKFLLTMENPQLFMD